MSQKTFRCLVIGEGVLPLQCCDILIARGHAVEAIVAPAGDASAWAAERLVQRIDPDVDLTKEFAPGSVDLLFSIVNPRVLTAQVCAIANVAAINYHDSPLPRYAGVNATTWAILAGETEHGITWHEVVATVDAGRILLQRPVPIASDDTAFTLDVKCYEAAVVSFAELVDGLCQETIAPQSQRLVERTYFGRHHRPTGAGTIDWDQTAESVSAFARGLDFDMRPNPIALPKIWIGETPFACLAVQVLQTRAVADPGTIMAIDDTAIVVACRDFLVRIETLSTLTGERVTPMAMGARKGDRLTGPAGADLERIDLGMRQAARHEQLWVKRLTRYRPPTLPVVGLPEIANASEARSNRIQLPERLTAASRASAEATLVAAIATYLARISDGTAFDISVANAAISVNDVLFMTSFPFRCEVDLSTSFADVVAATALQLRELNQQAAIAIDILSRYPALRGQKFRRGVTVALDLDGQSATVHFDEHHASGDVGCRISEHVEALLADAAEHPTRCVAELNIMSDAERALVVETWNDTAVSYPRDETIAALYSRAAMDHPDAIAIVDGTTQQTYRQLDERANRLAHRLQRCGVTVDTIVGHRIDRSANAIVALLGILKAGGAYLPLDTANPPARLTQMLEDCDVRIVVSTTSAAATVPTDKSRRIVLVDDDSLDDEITDSPICAARATSLAYVMYTSGSTGRPKGVAVTNRGVTRLVCNTNFAHFGRDEVWLGFAPFTFDASTLEIWGALLNGGRLALFPNYVPSAFELGTFIANFNVTSLFFTSALFNQMVDAALPLLGNVRQLVAGGDVLVPQRARRVLRELPNCQLINAYGPTENTTFSACYSVPAAFLPEAAADAVPIGRPIANSTAYVLDARRQPLPVGVVGALYVGGDGLARGYANDERKTANSFVQQSFDGLTEMRLYCTGDLARWRSDGVLEFFGRRDNQVKIRGFRVELGEIEAMLAGHPCVREVAVVAQSDRSGDPTLVAYYTQDDSHAQPTEWSKLREYLFERLPAYMVPSLYTAIDKLPLTPAGKVDRASLACTHHGTAVRRGPAPRTPTEIAVAAIWCDVFHTDYVSATDDFFRLGGHSLIAMQVLSRIADRFGVRLSLRTMFDSPTVAQLATRIEHVDAVQNIQPFAPAPTIPADETSRQLTLGQEVLWLLQRARPTLDAYNVAEQWTIAERIDVAILETALTALVARHDALRTTFLDGEDGLEQHAAPSTAVQVEVIDTSGMTEEERNDAVQNVVRRPFDLSRDLLLRASLLREPGSLPRLVIVTHHIVDDGWSRAILRRELTALYAALVGGRDARLPDITMPYTAFASRQRASLRNGRRSEHEAYWRARLANWQPTCYVPIDRPRPTALLFDGATVSTTLSRATLASVHAIAGAQGATPFMVLFAAFQLLLQRYSGESDIVVGTVSAAREQSEWENVIGYFATPMAIRTSFDDDPSFLELLERVRSEQLSAMEHAAMPIELVMTASSQGKVERPLPLFRVMCVLQQDDQSNLIIGDEAARALPISTGSTKFDLSLLLTERDGVIDATIEYRTSMFDRATIARALEHYTILLNAAMQSPDTHVSRLPLASREERHRMLVEWNAAIAPLDERCLHDLVNEQIRRSPNAIAVVGVDATLTYAELGSRARQLANVLIARGVGPNVLVGICIQRSVTLIVALLAVLEAGGAYIPLDPDYPPERLRFMLADSGATIVLTSDNSREVLGVHTAGVIHLDDASWSRESGNDDGMRVPKRATADNLAYVMYTSGSTGRPKGAMNRHRAVCNFVRRSVELHGFVEGDTVLQKTPAAFDPSVWEIFGALTTGARLVLASPRGHADPAYLANIIAQQQVNVMNIVPSMLQALLDVPSFARQGECLRIIVCGGEVMSPALQANCFAQLPTVQLHNAYGPTEAAVNSCDWKCERDVPRAFVPIGRPLPNVHMYCLDEAREPVPAGVVGELYIGGAAVGAGYVGKPELTTDRFVQWVDPLRPGAVERLYRTGDLARMNRNGIIEFLGRRDHQIKLRGVRIELGEIEAALATHPTLRSASVMLRDDASTGEHRLVAYVVPHARASVSERELRMHLRGLLLDAMIPSAFVVLHDLPLSPTGKIDRAALPEPSYEHANGEPFIAPQTVNEVALARIVAQVLGIKRVGVHDNFFEIGGHSLAAMSVVARALREGVALSVTDLFDHPTIGELGSIVDALPLVASQNPASSSIPRVARAAYRRHVKSAGDS